MQMIIPPLPTGPSNAVTPQSVAHSIPIGPLAAAPMTERAVRPATNGEKGSRTRSNKDRTNGGDRAPVGQRPDEQRGHFINTSA